MTPLCEAHIHKGWEIARILESSFNADLAVFVFGLKIAEHTLLFVSVVLFAFS